MILKHRLLDHPFYQKWTSGEITLEQLSDYAHSYKELIGSIPGLWNKVLTGFEVDSKDSHKIVSDETEHIDLWNVWADKLNKPETIKSFANVIDELSEMTESELLGAIHAWESQQPEVAQTKMDGLKTHYGFIDADLEYFSEHLKEEEHIEFGLKLKEKKADSEQFNSGFEKGSKIFYNSLDMFIN